MSDLQLSLVIIGIIVIAGVWSFNWYQERRYRRRVEQAFEAQPDDVLLGGHKDEAGHRAAAAPERIEPQFERTEPQFERVEPQWHPDAAEADESPAPVPPVTAPEPAAVAAAASTPDVDPGIDFIAEIISDEPLAEDAVSELRNRISGLSKPVRCFGYDAAHGAWHDLLHDTPAPVTQLCVAIQLVNRAGPVNHVQLSAFCNVVRTCAERSGARWSCPDVEAALSDARRLDALCADVDITVGVNVVAADGAAIPAGTLRAAVELRGFELGADGTFRFCDDRRRLWFALANRNESDPLLPQRIAEQTLSGVTITMDVPRVAEGLEVLDHMIEAGRDIAHQLGAQLVDDNGNPLQAPGVDQIRRELAAVYAKMNHHDVAAGSARALRLFA
ncbi:MAG TPA: cell division protein ZipA C-terminal FtsZ-binding domain-containing protein [Burkholderiales bacterium]|jgi:FtsZ-interacting cell division protein ZipA|nr:cell division protein ZipA C-terminal FtsZ-binding domain-containing protein [Burkholderiales bacterium]